QLVHPSVTCSVPTLAAVQVAARCDASINPGNQSVNCRGTCFPGNAFGVPSCSADAEARCVGIAEAFECAGTCQGGCEVSTGAACAGECLGSCLHDGSVACNGECLGDSDGQLCSG